MEHAEPGVVQAHGPAADTQAAGIAPPDEFAEDVAAVRDQSATLGWIAKPSQREAVGRK